MSTAIRKARGFWLITVTVLALTSGTQLFAHCDTMNGPVVKAAKLALEKGDVIPILKWVKKEYEPEVVSVFKKVLSARAKGLEAKEIADMYFFETVVRLHRTGEGEPYTGIKPEGTLVDPGIENADRALESGDLNGLIKALTNELGDVLHERFEKAARLKKHADQNAEEGRKFVEAYVAYIHFVEQAYEVVRSENGHGDKEKLHQ